MNLREFRARSPSVARAKWAPASGIHFREKSRNHAAPDATPASCPRWNHKPGPTLLQYPPEQRRK